MKIISYISLLLGGILILMIELFDLKASDWYIVMGQAHFGLAYFYKIKSKKEPPKISFYFYYLGFAMAIFGLYYFFRDYQILVFVTSYYFVIHFIFNIFDLFNDKRSVLERIIFSLPLFGVYTVCIFDMIGMNEAGSFIFRYILPLTLLTLLFLRKENKWYFFYFGIFSLIVVVSRVFYINDHNSFMGVFAKQAMAFIILSHYIVWYIYYYHKIPSPVFTRNYSKHIIVFNVISFLLFFIYMNSEFNFLGIFFTKENFFLWTLLFLVV